MDLSADAIFSQKKLGHNNNNDNGFFHYAGHMHRKS